MAKNKEQILEELGLNANSEIEVFLEALEKYSTVSPSELTAVKSISVKTLPTVVENQEELVKKRMVGIVTDESKGVASILNKRSSLIYALLSLMHSVDNGLREDLTELQSKVNNFTDLGVIDSSPSGAGNETLNRLSEGIYTFSFNGNRYIMLQNSNRMQLILGYESFENPCSLSIIERNLSTGSIKVSTMATQNDLTELENTIQNDYISKNTSQSIYAEHTFVNGMQLVKPAVARYNPTQYNHLTPKQYVDDKVNQLFGEGQVADTLDTISEISQALADNVEVVDALNDAIVTKADKEYVEYLENKIAFLEKITPKTSGVVVDDTLVLFNADVVDDTLYISKATVKNGILYI